MARLLLQEIDIHNRHDTDTGEQALTDSTQSQQISAAGIVSNAFGERSLFAINRNLFQNSDASTIFRTHFGESLFKEDTFYIIAGTDSGLLYRYVKSRGVPENSHYLFVELPEVLDLLHDLDSPEEGISVTTEKEWQQRANDMDILGYAIQGNLKLLGSLGVVHGHFSEYWPFWQRIKDTHNAFTQRNNIALNNQGFIARQLENLSENQNPAIFLKGLFSQKTAVILGGGPSLHETLPWVRENRKDLLVMAVSRISGSLLQENIKPDIIVAVDPMPIILGVSREVFEFQDSALLINEYHLSSNLLSGWAGKKAYIGKRYPWPTPLEPENLPPTVGYTVTNTAATLAIEAGVEQIVLGGVDFCFSQEGYTHANGSAEHSLGSQPLYGNKRVLTNSGKMANTDFQFMASANALSAMAAYADEKGCLIINPAPGAMSLPHILHIPLEYIEVSPMAKPAQKIIEDRMPKSGRDERISLYSQDLAEIERVLDELIDIKDLSEKALSHNREILDQTSNNNEHGITEKIHKIENIIDHKYHDTAYFIKQFGVKKLIPIIHHNETFDGDPREGDILHHQVMIETSQELIEILRWSQQRILCRIEEESLSPDMDRLFKQWRKDQHLGRSIQWKLCHPEIANKLPDEDKIKLKALHDDFDEYLEKIARLHFLGVERGVSLDGLSARAREYFQCQDEEGLRGLLEGLNKHRDKDKASEYIPLIKGYMAEIHGKIEKSVSEYESLKEGPAYLDALTRLFELYTTNGDTPSSLETLKKMSIESSTYSPMYADLLQATGDIEAAVNIYTEYLLENPDDLNSMMKLGLIYHQHNAKDGVEWTMNYILGKDPENETAKAMLRSLKQPQAND